MSWTYKRQRSWRIALLVVMIIAFMGPWMFERLNVPAKYACSPPNIRLEGDFCGTPIAGVQVFAWMIFWVLNIVAGLITHKTALANSGFEFLIGLIYSLLLFLLILPIINMVRLLLRRFYPRRGLFTIISLVLAIGVSLFLGFFNYPNFHWAAWGIWLYVGLAAIALILEIVLFREQNRQDPDLTVTSVENEVTVN